MPACDRAGRALILLNVLGNARNKAIEALLGTPL
jgi:hypothetical protein